MDPRLLGQARQPDGRAVVDLVGDGGVQVAEGIVGERREMDDRLEALQVARLDVANILAEIAQGERIVSG